jgi:hypothetical protein
MKREALLAQSIVAGVYEKTVDRASAFEALKGRTQSRAAPATEAEASSGGGILGSLGDMLGGGARRSRAGVGEQIIRSAASAVGREVGRQIIRGVLGSILGGSRR